MTVFKTAVLRNLKKLSTLSVGQCTLGKTAVFRSVLKTEKNFSLFDTAVLKRSLNKLLSKVDGRRPDPRPAKPGRSAHGPVPRFPNVSLRRPRDKTPDEPWPDSIQPSVESGPRVHPPGGPAGVPGGPRIGTGPLREAGAQCPWAEHPGRSSLRIIFLPIK